MTSVTTMNLLKGGSFDSGKYYHKDKNGHDITQVQCGIGFVPWWHESDTRPEFVVDARDAARRVLTGVHCQHFFNTFATHTAGIYQRIVSDGSWSPGDKLTLTAHVQAWSRGHDKDPTPDDPSESNGRYRMRVGIDPYGGTDPESEDIVWSVVVQPYDEYYAVGVTEVEAMSNRATVFVWGQAEWGMKHNDAYVDDIQLVAIVAEDDDDDTDDDDGDDEDPPEDPENLVNRVASEVEKRVMLALASAMSVLANIIKTGYTAQ